MRICEYKRHTFIAMTVRDWIKVFKALSEGTRLRILNILTERECCVCEVMQALDISQSRASRNLGILEDAGLVTSRREGLWVIYSINAQKKGDHVAPLIEFLRHSLEDELIRQDKERLRQAKRVGPRVIGR
jgi:ArsR family transcriptional regulator